MRLPLPVLPGVALLLSIAWSRSASADCSVDTDCPGSACGDPVCQLSVGGSNCVNAGTDVQGFDGECAADVDCKCASQGATCYAATGHCTFTVPQSTDDASSTTSAAAAGDDGTDVTPSCATSPRRAKTPFPSAAVALGAAGVLAATRRRGPRR
jgi:hypothetical protein